MAKRLNLNKILQNPNTRFINMEEALKDSSPAEWSEDVLNGRKQVLVTKVERVSVECVKLETSYL